MKSDNFERPNNSGPKTLYNVLGIYRDATDEEIKKAYRRIVKETHPDAVGNDSCRAEFDEATKAYEILIDKEEREKYDRRAYAEYRAATGQKTTEKNKYYDNLSDEDKQAYNRLMADETMGPILKYYASSNRAKFEATVEEYLEKMREIRKSRAQSDEDLAEAKREEEEAIKIKEQIRRDREELRRRREELEKEIERRREQSGGIRRDPSNLGETLKRGSEEFARRMSEPSNFGHYNRRDFASNNFSSRRPLTADFDVTDVGGFENLVSKRNGQRVGNGIFKKISVQNGLILGTDILGHKSIIDKNGESSFQTFKDIIFKDGLIIGQDIIGQETLIDYKTLKPRGYKTYVKIYKSGNRIMGVDAIGGAEEIK